MINIDQTVNFANDALNDHQTDISIVKQHFTSSLNDTKNDKFKTFHNAVDVLIKINMNL